MLLVGGWAAFSAILSKTSYIKYKEALALDFPTYFPLFVFALTPLALSHYLTFDDLQARLNLFLIVALFAVFYLKAAQTACLNREGPSLWSTRLQKFLALPLRKQLWILFLAALVLYNGGSLLMMSNGVSFSGDEPHYLLITHSLLFDRDFDLANNYGRQDYTKYMGPLPVLRPHAIPGLKTGSQYSFHSPGVSILLLPFYALGSFFGRIGLIFFLRFGMSLFGALLGLELYLFALQEWRKERLALGLWFLFGFTAPVFFYSIHVYPEIIIALFSFTVFRFFRFSPLLSKPKLLLCGLLLSLFIWFHALKYFFLLGPLFLYCLWVLIKKHKIRSGLAYFLASPVLIIVLYFWFQYSLYGSLNPTSVSWQGAMDSQQSLGFIKSLLTGIPFRFRIETLAGYFLDQRDGLLFYAPIYFFAFFGLVEIIRRKSRDALWLLFITAPYVLVSAFLTQRTGYAPQARPLAAVNWGLAILLGYFLASNAKKIFAFLLNFAAGLSLLFVWLLCQNPLALYQETTVGTTERAGDLFSLISNLHLRLSSVLPSFLKIEEWRWLPNLIWPALILLFIAAYLLVPRHDLKLKFGHHLALTGIGLALFFGWFVFYPRVVLMSPRKAELRTGEKLTFYSLSRVALMREPGRFALLEDNRDYNFYFTSWRTIGKLKIEFGSANGDYELRLSFFDKVQFEEKTEREIKAKIFVSPPAYRWNKNNLYRISIHLEKKSEVRTVRNPYLFAIQTVR